MNAREIKAAEIADKFKIVNQGQVWVVPSQSTSQKYKVRMVGEQSDCTCPDFELRRSACKHVMAVQIVIQKEQNPDGTVTVTETVTVSQRKTYKQQWPEYNQAQTNEGDYFQKLLHGLCSEIETPEQKGKGQRRLPLADAIFAATYKIYSTVSARRFMSELRESKERGYIDSLPHFNSILNYLDNAELRPILTRLIELSAMPLASVENDFAVDSSGFSTSRYERWFNHKYGQESFKREWVKVHICVGVKTNIVTAVEIADKNAADAPMLPALVEKTAEGFEMKEVSGDKAYLSTKNLDAIRSVNALPFIPFKSNSASLSHMGKGHSKAWREMYGYFLYKHDVFLESYHKRSNVESTFSAIKRKFGESLRSKSDVAMVNEALCKILCHNIVVLIHEMFELGIDPVFLHNGKVAAQRELN
jgi:transposase